MPPIGQVPGTPGRRLRLQRRKNALDQEGLARLLGVDKETVSKMENNALPLTTEAEAFIANPPAKAAASATARPPRPSRAKPRAEELPPESPEVHLPPNPDAASPGDGPGPRVEQEDKPPMAGRAPRAIAPLPREGEIEELERALRTLFAGEAFLVPREQPDGTIQHVEAIIPGIAQMIGMVDEFDGIVIRTHAPGMARAWADLARDNATVRKVLIGLTYGGAYRGVIAATAPAVMAIAFHHGAFGLGQPKAPAHVVVEHPVADQPPARDPFGVPEYVENGDGTWTAPNGLVGVFGPQGFVAMGDVVA